MRQFRALTGFLFLLAPGAACAQVTVNPAALRQLAGISAPPPVDAASVPAPARHETPRKTHRAAHRAVHHAAHHAAEARPKAAPAAVPKPAPAPKLAAPKPIAPVSLAFAPGSADLPGGAQAALHPFCADRGRIAIDARAPADPSDVSAAMRLSLARAMAVQAALTACGVPAQNILPRADGAVPGANENEAVVGSGAEK